MVVLILTMDGRPRGSSDLCSTSLQSEQQLLAREPVSVLAVPTTDSSESPRRRAASFQIHPQPIFLTAIAAPRQFFAQAVQFVQSSLLAIKAGPVSGISQTPNGQTSRHMPQRLHIRGSYSIPRPVSSNTIVILHHQPMKATTKLKAIMKTIPAFNV